MTFDVSDEDLENVQYIVFKVKSDGQTLGELPEGLKFDRQTGVIKGTLSEDLVGKEYLVGIGVVDDDIIDGEEWTCMTVNYFMLVVDTEARIDLADGTVGTAASYDCKQDGAVRYEAVGLPNGLSLATDTGIITGDFTWEGRRGTERLTPGYYRFSVVAYGESGEAVSTVYYGVEVKAASEAAA